MGHGRGKSAGGRPPPPPPVAAYNVTGELTPDATCNYFQKGMHNGKRWYRRADKAYFIWWYIQEFEWAISTSLGSVEGPFWVNSSSNILDIYAPFGGAAGFASVSVGAH